MGNGISLHRLWPCFAAVAIACTEPISPTSVRDGNFTKSVVADNEVVPNSYVVSFANPKALTAQARRTIARGHVKKFGGKLTFVYDHLGGYAVDDLPASAAAALRKLPEIAYVEPNYITKLSSFTQANPGPGLDRLDQRNLPLSNEFSYAYAGEGVHIYILDSGVDTTSGEWAGRIGNGVTCVLGLEGSGGEYEDTFYHGTAVASVAAGTTFGIAKFATIHSVRISIREDGTSTTAETNCGINWVAGHGIRPAVANMSYGGYPNAFSTRDAISNLILNYNISFVKSAGNDNTDAFLDRANRATNEFVVGAVNPRNDTIASWSNYAVAGSPSVNFIAPGVSVLAADRFPGPGRLVSGTSFAAPYVAGVIAQYLHYDPTATSQGVYDAMMTHFLTWGVVQGLTGTKAATPNRLLYSNLWCVPGPC